MNMPTAPPRKIAGTLWRLLKQRKGAAAVEFGLVLPVFLTIVFAVIQFGLVFVIESSMSNAAREEVRQIALAGGELQGRNVTASVLSRLEPWSSNFPDGFTVISSPPNPSLGGGSVYVEISFDLDEIAFGDILSLLVGQQLVTRVAAQPE